MRAILLIVHRWAGLTIALALVLTGLTGAILPFQRELGYRIAADVWQVAPPHPGAQPLSGIELMHRVEQQTGGTVSYIKLEPTPGLALAVFVSAPQGHPPLPYDEVFVDPYTGAIRASVHLADLDDGAVNIMPFLVRFHYTLAAGPWGRFILGIAALIWVPVCLAGLVLSLPRGRLAGGVAGRLHAWAPAWKIRRGQGARILTYDLHRASGLWIWPVMLVFAWSAVAFNLDDVHEPVQRFFGARGLYNPPENSAPAQGERLSPQEAAEVGARLMAQEAVRQGFAIRGPEAISFNSHAHAVGYYARTSLDGPTERGSTAVWFDEVSGRQIGFRHPFGTTPADAFDKATRLLHTADLFGWPYRIFVSLIGLLTAASSIAGLLVWLRRSRRGSGGRSAAPESRQTTV
ncbi:hypothetical protein SZ64_09765 [Erythrobacter sp. SG61-1L]|uniref:PepSY-associated TM helix domain-containing protein n=1 Tax=Erythrobacter sp. SG61-1L TaxID=1603897 RepID=UPI0006C8F940|nr:PepSY-associated TM helix domain-containing protein [Erythrobacter sp. SG61-1L]KPL68381.1 hypothetical protein SZ64_09765 [Erythrobacter sp. SG61-1L]